MSTRENIRLIARAPWSCYIFMENFVTSTARAVSNRYNLIYLSRAPK